eukprot:1194199-Prorocentrum_minimum.AAC.1
MGQGTPFTRRNAHVSQSYLPSCPVRAAPFADGSANKKCRTVSPSFALLQLTNQSTVHKLPKIAPFSESPPLSSQEKVLSFEMNPVMAARAAKENFKVAI